MLAVSGDSWLRGSLPFAADRAPLRFVPGVGVLWEPNGEVRYTNLSDFWTISRANRLGFLDREPMPPQRAASGCHIALVGDSFVDAMEVRVPEKSQVRLEALAARERPDWDITTSAFGRVGTGQVQRIPFYDAYLRRMSPKFVVLVTYRNDFSDNSRVLGAVLRRSDPECVSWAAAVRGEDGRFTLQLPRSPCRVGWRRRSVIETALKRGGRLGGWARRYWRVSDFRHGQVDAARRQVWRRLGPVQPVLSGWRPPSALVPGAVPFAIYDAEAYGAEMAPVIREAYDATSFALAEFQRRGRRDGFELLVPMADHDDPLVSREIEELAERRGIPVVSLRGWIARRGEQVSDARFSHDWHWGPQRRRWVAEALSEHLKEHSPSCRSADAGDSPSNVPPGSNAS